MTSEGSHRPGQEPDEVSPGAGGPAPYGDRTPQQNSPYGAPDLGWAPPPPANRPQSPAPAWAPQNDQPATAAWGAPPAVQPGEAAAAPGTWGPAAGTSQAEWASQQEQSGAWGAAAQQAPEQDEQPAWGQQAPQAAPGWPQPAARGAAQVPQPAAPAPGGWPAADEAPQSGGWNGAPDNPATSGGWPADARQDDAPRPGWNDGQDDPARSGGWNAGGQQDDPARSGGWRANAAPQDDQPAWAQQAAQAAPAWPQAQPAARGAAQVPQPAAPAQDARPGQDDPARSGGWQQEPGPQADPATSGGWNAPQDDPARSGGWNRSTEDDPARSGGWNGSAQDEAARGGGWNGSAQDEAVRGGSWNDSTQDDPARSGGWDGSAQDDPARSGGWNAGAGQPAVGRGSASVPQQQNGERPEQDWPAQDEPASGGGWAASAAVPQQGDRGDNAHWPRTEPTSAPPARATATVTGDEGPPPWTGPATENAGQWGAERSTRQDSPETAPWSPGDGWNRQEAEPAADNGWESHRAEEPPAYQPGPAPGISPANAVPLPPQEQRVPGASLAAAPPADYPVPAQYSPFEQPGRDDAGRGYPTEQGGDAWGGADAARDEPQSPAGPPVPGPRTSPESGRASVPGADANAGIASASASVPMASRVTPPTDQPLHPGGNQPPQPRVYGRPARPEPEQDESEQDESGHEQGQQQHFDDQDRPPATRAYAAAVPVPSGPPAPPAFPTGMPNFADPAGNNRPMNGTRPHATDEHPGDPYGAGRPLDGTQPYGQPAVGEQHQGGFPPAFPGGQQNAFPGGQQGGFPGGPQGGFPGGQQDGFPGGPQDGPSWGGPPEPEQGRFDSFKPEAEPKAEQPVPKVRNGRVLAVVLLVAVLILAIPLGLLALLGKIGGEDESAPKFNPAVGSCVKRSGTTAATATCGEPGSFTVVSKVDDKKPCADPGQPHVVLPDGTTKLCLKPAPTK
ncbi:hypothetical protein [Micromonospora mirobrigensis]|uniref:Integrin beta 8 n=1 Tax=Micromonospora mirobrigensis TaxID=262898 RepID=A0A1C4VR77_9ACTN|nr:hypothetical protein [Micromonospora mirobrigensis]SCE86453.1 hypothetical protein GA0070564_1011390 [Micromonospora mirobrigensis]